MKLSEILEKHGNKEVDEWAVVNVLGLKTSDKPKTGERYWFVGGDGYVHDCAWQDDDTDNFFYSQGNCFATNQEAETYRRVLETESKLRQYAKEHNDGVIEWDGFEQRKYYMYLGLAFNTLCLDMCDGFKHPRTIYFTSSKIANAAVESVGKEAVMEYLKYEW